ncbi:MAG: FAD-dependent oxidoreductase [Campylobacterota bacterium]|nr:FAD-dependent oxidoreductase [Campylobacterota bacterium]
MYDVLIIGGGAAGYGCALTLTSVEDKFEWAKDKKYLMIDNGKSDILNASFFNLAGVQFGIGGDELLSNMEKQLANFKSCNTINDTVTKITKTENGYEVVSEENSYNAKIVLIATGMHKFDIECDLTNILDHNDIMKPNKVCLENQNNKIADNLYVAGLASGAKTMFAIANGEGAKVACDIFKLWTGKSAVAHDTIKDKI